MGITTNPLYNEGLLQVEEKPSSKPPVEMQAEPWENGLVERLRQVFGEDLLGASSYLGQHFLVIRADATIPVIQHLKNEGFDFLADLTAVDYPKRDLRFELIYVLARFGGSERIRVKTQIADGAIPASVTGIYPGANWLEREVFDMFGIRFDGHPDMRRILLPDEWQGFPLRKEYGITEMDNAWVQANLGIESGQ